jgi:uncharacterized protein
VSGRDKAASAGTTAMAGLAKAESASHSWRANRPSIPRVEAAALGGRNMPPHFDRLTTRAKAVVAGAGDGIGNHRRAFLTGLGAAGIVVVAYLVVAGSPWLAGATPDRLRNAADQPALVPGAAARPLPPERPPVLQAAATPQPQGEPSSSDAVARVGFYLDRAKAGDPVAQYDLGVLYARGSGLVQDFTSAASWFHAAAAQGNVSAEYNLGVLYDRGLGVPQSATEAINWYRSAADQDHPGAQYNLALAYADGRGTDQDFAAAARWYERAARQGLPAAMVNLAILYETGQGVDRSLIDAYAWYGAAGERGDSAAKDRAEELFRQFTDQDKARAQGLAATIGAAVNGPPPG